MNIIKRIELNNFKVYHGRQAIDCSITNSLDKPLVIIGGLNGAGKTSIIEALKLCLFGEKAKRLQQNYRSYNRLLKALHNRKAVKDGDNQFSLTIDMEIVETGMPYLITIDRKWSLQGDKYKEYLTLYRDGEEMQFIEKEFWQDYINDITPLGLADLIYFDSEQFRTIPDFLENGFLDSLMNFFGLDVYGQLSKDLDRYKLHTAALINPELEEEIKRYDQEITEYNIKIEEINAQKRQLEDSLSKLRKDKNDISDELKKRAGKRALKQDRITKKKDKIVQKMEAVNIEYQELCSKHLPFNLCKNLTSQLINSLNDGINENRGKSARIYIDNYRKDILGDLSKKYKGKDLKEIESILESKLPGNKHSNKLKHVIADKKAREVISFLENALDIADQKLLDNRDKFNQLYKDRNATNRDLMEVRPEGPDKKLFDQLFNIEKEIGKNDIEHSYLPSRIRKLNQAINGAELKKVSLLNKIEKRNPLKVKIDHAEKINHAITEYKNYLTQKRFKDFKNNFLEIIKVLAKKEDLVHDIHLDTETKKFTFLNDSGDRLNVKDFSAGESEILALSILWAINKTSGKNHPIITDSPLNRLDGEHRKRFIDNFVKKSPHQIMFLSTDKELNDSEDYGIDKYINKKFIIDYDSKLKVSKFKEGYFTV